MLLQYNMPLIQKKAPQSNNPFYLYDSQEDTDEDCEKEDKSYASTSTFAASPAPPPSPELFASSASPVSPELSASPAPSASPAYPAPTEFRKWIKKEDSRFSTEIKHDIFNSPFSKGKYKDLLRQQSKSEWGTIPWNKPQFQEDIEIEYNNYSDNDFPSLLKRNEHVCEMPASEITAVAWAERIRKSLDKSELMHAVKMRKEVQENPEIGRLSFFRRVMI